MEHLSSAVDFLTKLGLSPKDIFEIIFSLGVGMFLNGTRLETISNIVNKTRIKSASDKEKILPGKSGLAEIQANEKSIFFEIFRRRKDTFNYFKDRMNGENGREVASRIAVTYFVDVSPIEENDEKEYFELQTGLVMSGRLEVRRILLIKNKRDFEKMIEQLKDLGKSNLFELGIYILAEDNDVATKGNFKRHLNFNFMIIDDNEFCFNNGNRYAEYTTSTITHKRLAEEMNKHIVYLWDNSYKVKLNGREYFERNILDDIEVECKARGIISMDYIYTLA
jgi:hypothetical protein